MSDAAVRFATRDRLRRRRHRRVRARRPRLLLPRAERPHPGRASGDRARHRRRPRAVAAPSRARGGLDVRARARTAHAVEVRLYAEDPRTFLPQAGPDRAAAAAVVDPRRRGRRRGRRGRDRLRPDDREADRARRDARRRRSTGSRRRSRRPRSSASPRTCRSCAGSSRTRRCAPARRRPRSSTEHPPLSAPPRALPARRVAGRRSGSTCRRRASRRRPTSTRPAPDHAGRRRVEHVVGADAGHRDQGPRSRGSTVKARKPLVVLEAMKMETPLVSPYDATVRAVHVAGRRPCRGRRAPGRAGRLARAVLAARRLRRGRAGSATFEAPTGSGKDQYWVVRAQGKPKAVVVLLHGLGQNSGEQLEPWQAHLAREGYDVIYPRYESRRPTRRRATTSSARSGARSATLGRPKVPLILLGHSRGGTTRSRGGGLPQAAARDRVLPGADQPDVRAAHEPQADPEDDRHLPLRR